MTTLIAFILSFPLLAATAQQTNQQPEQPLLSEANVALISAYEGTREPLLPPVTNEKVLERKVSTVPGRMHLTRHITVNKEACRLTLQNVFGDVMLQVPVCASRNRGQKHAADDCRTPEGNFSIYGVYNSTDWTYKDTDSKCYGPFFIYVNTPGFYGIGIHGTNAPGSVPGRSSHGCMRLHNENIVRLKPMVQKEIRVTITPDRVG